MKKYEEKSNGQIERVTEKDSVRERKEWRNKNVLCVCLSLYVGVLERENWSYYADEEVEDQISFC